MTEKGELGWLGRYTLPCILSHTYLQPYPSILAHVQTLNSTYAGPERDLIYSAYLVIDDLQNTLWNEFDNGSPKLTVQSLKTTYSTARQSLVAARKLNNKAVALAEKVENTANEKLKNVQVTTTTQTPRPNPTPEVECCPPNAEIASVCSTYLTLLLRSHLFNLLCQPLLLRTSLPQ
ncbi:hypothetical protein HK097_009020 [Rhizophlyctis rosea]|uniref:Uncharacterized protein n=1 Tax=Rhizophlyctis rosea TaxID=64517 RepID=A0AAD5S9I5_9FUNG|nr:hypothetical protein HK097_009020 [Rhizophlyctis rosea]